MLPTELDNELGVLSNSFRDMVLELDRREAALRDSEANLQQAQETARIGSWTYDMATDRATWTPEMFRIVGCDPELGEPTWEENRKHVHPDDWDPFSSAVRGTMEAGKPHDIEFRIVPRGGEVRWARCLGVAVRDGAGKIVSMHGTLQDITERKQIQERLHQMEKMDAIGHLAGGVAHDFNNQLAAIMGYADLLAESLEDGDAKTLRRERANGQPAGCRTDGQAVGLRP